METHCRAFRCKNGPAHNEPVGAEFQRLAVERVEDEREWAAREGRDAEPFEYAGWRDVGCYMDSETVIRHPKRETAYVHEDGNVQCYSACANYVACSGCEVCGFEAAMRSKFG